MSGILIADDHQVMRAGLLSLLRGAQLEVCGEAENGKQAIEKVRELHPSLVILDISMPVMNGLEAARQIRQMDPSIKILIFTMHDSPAMEREALQAGANAVLVKSRPGEELVNAVKSLLQPAK